MNTIQGVSMLLTSLMTPVHIAVTGVIIGTLKRYGRPVRSRDAALRRDLDMCYLFGGKALRERAWELIHKDVGSGPRADLRGGDADDGTSASSIDPTDTTGAGSR